MALLEGDSRMAILGILTILMKLLHFDKTLEIC